MNNKLLVYIEENKGQIEEVSLELLSEACRLKDKMDNQPKISAVMIGSELEKHLDTLSNYGAEEIILADSAELAEYHPLYYSQIMYSIIDELSPQIILFGATYTGANLASASAEKLKTGLAAHAIDLKLDEDDNLIAVVPAFGGKVLGDILFPEDLPQIATIKPGVFEKIEKERKDIEVKKFDLSKFDFKSSTIKLLQTSHTPTEGVELGKAEIIICGGRGVKKEKHWGMLKKIADKLGGAAACTRPVVDKGWASENIMIGTSGKNVKAKIYIGFGISGATHHICGIQDSNLILSVNIDEDAEIFDLSDYGIVGDAEEIIPELYSLIVDRNIEL